MSLQVAALIHSLQLERNGATLLLSNLLDEEDGDADALTRPATKVRHECQDSKQVLVHAAEQHGSKDCSDMADSGALLPSATGHQH